MSAPRLTVYNPDLLGRDDLVASFVARRPLLAGIVDDLRRKHPNHRLLLGPRGMGKTTLLRRLYFAVHEDAELASRWMPVVFREEQYNVARLSDLWLNSLDALSDALEERGRGDEAAKLDDAAEAIRALPEDRRERESRAALLGWARKRKRRLLLLVDNFDLVLDRLSDDLQWKLREVLSEESVTLIGASAHTHPATYEYKRPFYDFFKIDSLRGLDEDEAAHVLLMLSDLRNTPEVREIVLKDRGRIETLRVLTGGNPRAIVLVHQVLARAEERTVVEDVTALLDLSTPLYKARFEDLAQQAQLVVDALALAWDPQPAGAVAERLAMDVSLVSAQLSRLVKDGVVEKVSYPGARAGYQIAERLFNVWYLMRASRRARKRLLWLVSFLRDFYGPTRLRARAEAIAKSGRDDEDGELLLALSSALEGEEKLTCELRALELLAHASDFRTKLDLDGEDAHLAARADRMEKLAEIRRLLAHAGTMPDGEPIADALCRQPIPVGARLAVAHAILDPMRRDEALRLLRPREDVEYLSAVGTALARGLIDAPFSTNREELRGVRTLVPKAHAALLTAAGRAAANAAELAMWIPDLEKTNDVLPWIAWLTRADELGAFAPVGALFEAVPATARDASFWRSVTLTGPMRAAAWAAAHYFALPGVSDRFAFVLPYLADPAPRARAMATGESPWPSVHALAGDWDAAVRAFDPQDEEDLPAMARGALIHGRGEDAIAWLDATGLTDRARPIREGLAAAVRGEDHLKTIAPEVRAAAETYFRWLTFDPTAQR